VIGAGLEAPQGKIMIYTASVRVTERRGIEGQIHKTIIRLFYHKRPFRPRDGVEITERGLGERESGEDG
jgi:hypothetical protein